MQLDPKQFAYDLEDALRSVVTVRSLVPDAAFTAETLGTERVGHGAVIDRAGLVLTIGYLVTEAETIWLSLPDGGAVQAHVAGFDYESGFGLLQTLGPVGVPALPLGRSEDLAVGQQCVLAGGGGMSNAVLQRVVAKQEFAGYWEYVLDEAVFTAPAHSHWGGTALIDASGAVAGIGSLSVQHASGRGKSIDINMVVPIDLLPPILDDLLRLGRPRKPARPWLGLYAIDVDGAVTVSMVVPRGPAAKAGIGRGDRVVAVGDQPVARSADFFRAVWQTGDAGVLVPLALDRNGKRVDVAVRSVDRRSMLLKPRMH
jgi:S1-C subfamily serine protease